MRPALLALALALAAPAATPGQTPTASPAAPSGPAPAGALSPASAAPSATPSPTPAAKDPVRPADALSAAELKEAISLLRRNYVDPVALDELALQRAQLEGVLARLGTGARLLTVAASTGANPASLGNDESPFRSEVLTGGIGYVRLGAVTRPMLPKLDAALRDFTTRKAPGVILDLRATPAAADYAVAAECIGRFVAKGRPLFTLRKPATKEERLFTSSAEPLWTGFVAIVADGATAGVAEVVAAGIRAHAQAMVIGQPTAGQAVETSDLALGPTHLLRIVVAEVAPPAGIKLFPDGLKPDVAVADAPTGAERARILLAGLEKGPAAVIAEADRLRINEVALVAGVNPEVEMILDMQRRRREKPEPATSDLLLQRAVDLVTAVTMIGGTSSK